MDQVYLIYIGRGPSKDSTCRVYMELVCEMSFGVIVDQNFELASRYVSPCLEIVSLDFLPSPSFEHREKIFHIEYTQNIQRIVGFGN